MKFLAVDLGASSGRTIVGTVADGKIVLDETHRFANGIDEIDGGSHWNLERLVAEVTTGIGKSGDVDGIGVDTWGVDFGLVDADGQLLDQPFAYRDSRNELAMPAVFKEIPRQTLYKRTGTQPMFFNTIFQLKADQARRPIALAKAERLLFMPELITYLLGGEMHSEYCISSTSGLLDPRTRDWDRDLMQMLGIPQHIFGNIEQPGARAGSYNGIPLFLPPMHDTASAVAAVPATDDADWAFLSSGTWSLIGAELDQPWLDDRTAAAEFTNEGGIGGKIRFLKNVNGLWLIQECRRNWRESGQDLSFNEIATAAQESTFNEIINPSDSRFIAPQRMVDEIGQALREAGRPEPRSVGDVARCCYRSLAVTYGRILRELEGISGKKFQRLHVVGGGSKDDLLNQMTADELKIPVLAGPVEATALGNISSMALANGVFGSIPEMRQAIARSFPVKVFEPNG